MAYSELLNTDNVINQFLRSSNASAYDFLKQMMFQFWKMLVVGLDPGPFVSSQHFGEIVFTYHASFIEASWFWWETRGSLLAVGCWTFYIPSLQAFGLSFDSFVLSEDF